MNLYTKEQMYDAFVQGKKRGMATITGTSIAYDDFDEFIVKVKPRDIDEHLLEIVNRKMEQTRLAKMVPPTHAAITSAVVRSTHEVIGAVGVSYDEMVAPSDKGKPRQKDYITTPRLICYYLCYLHTGLSYPKIGKVYGNRGHDTVLAGARSIHQWKQTSPLVSRLINHTYTLLEDQGYDTKMIESKIATFKPIQDENKKK